MDHSSENVTLMAAFVIDILKNYQDKKNEYKELFELASTLDLSDPMNKVSMTVYNEMCNWIEKNLGKFNLIRVGRNVGETAFDGMMQFGLIKSGAKPLEVMQGLVQVASSMIQDPKGRGWEIVSSEPKAIVIKRTQTFNSKLQLGLLDGLIRKSGVAGVKVDYVKEVAAGAEFDEYKITWL
jgi:hypothetical protein